MAIHTPSIIFNVTFRFFKEFTDPYYKKLVYLWIVMWKWVGPIVMLIIFVSSLIRAIVVPPDYERYDEVSQYLHIKCVLECFFFSLPFQYETMQTVYPSWALFLGALIVLTSISTIPTVLIVRLIAYQEAREEAVEFLARMYVLIREAWEWLKTSPTLLKACCARCKNRSHLGSVQTQLCIAEYI